MNAFKRLCLFIFGLAGLACLAALVLPWFGPWTEQAIAMLRVPWYYITLEVCICITALGLLITLLRAIFTPRRRKSVVVSTADGDQITVTTSAISSQAAYIIESRGDLTAEHVSVVAHRNQVDVSVRVRPTHAMNVAEMGAALHAELVGGLSELAGDTIRSVVIEFVESDSLDSAPTPAYSAPSQQDTSDSEIRVPSLAEARKAQDASSFEITVPMGHAASTEGEPPESAAPIESEPMPESAPVATPKPEPVPQPADPEEV